MITTTISPKTLESYVTIDQLLYAAETRLYQRYVRGFIIDQFTKDYIKSQFIRELSGIESRYPSEAVARAKFELEEMLGLYQENDIYEDDEDDIYEDEDTDTNMFANY